MSDQNSARAKLWGMIKDHRFAMLTTQEDGGVLRSRPMTTVAREFDGTLWFFAKSDSAAAWAVGTHRQVCLSYCDEDDMDFVSVAGPAVVVTDTAAKKELWNPAVQAWFPEGPDSPYNVLIEVTAEHAEFWDSKSSRLVQLFSMARALAAGGTPRGIGEHREVQLPDRDASGADVRS
jgi:general stress protein 26